MFPNKYKLLCLLLISVIAAGPYAAVTANSGDDIPKIIYNSWKAFPDDAISINGAELKNAFEKVSIQAIVNDDEVDCQKASYKLRVINAQDSIIQGLLPQNMPRGLYALWVDKGATRSEPFFINKAELFRVSESTCYSGQRVRIFGRNMLNPASGDLKNAKVQLVDEKTAEIITAKIVLGTEYTVDFIVPDNAVIGGRYIVQYQNGVGGTAGWARAEESGSVIIAQANKNLSDISDMFGIEAHWLTEVPSSKRYNASDYGAKGDGVTDDTAALQKMLDSSKENGGGLAYIPAGEYLVSQLSIPERTILVGAGMDKTVLKYNGALYPADKPDKRWQMGEPCNMIFADADYVGLTNLAIVNDIIRPKEDWRRRISGWVCCVTLGYNPDVYKIGMSIPSKHSGYFLKNVKINNADGTGVSTINRSDFAVEDCYIKVTHSCVYGGGGKENSARILNTYLYNEQRPAIQTRSNGAWVEGCTFESKNTMDRREPLWQDLQTYTGERPLVYGKNIAAEHRYMDMWWGYNYIANNNVCGDYGTRLPQDANDGEGFLTQWTSSNLKKGAVVSGAVTEADEASLTDANLKEVPNRCKDWIIVITSGRGAGQLRIVTEHDETSFKIDKPWTVIPDETSTFEIDVFCAYKNIWVNNNITADTRKGAFMMYTKGFDNIVANNISSDSSGILFACSLRANGAAFFQYYAYVEGNVVTRHIKKNRSDGSFNGLLAIGQGWDGGAATVHNVFHGRPCLASMFHEYRNNSIIMYDRENINTCTLHQENFSHFSGFTVSAESNDGLARTVGYIISGNEAVNTYNGVYVGSGARDTVIYKNRFVNTVKEEVSEDSGKNTIIVPGSFDKSMVGAHAGINKLYFTQEQ